MTTYRILWDNGSASGVFPIDFTSEEEAVAYGDEWVQSMVAADDDPAVAEDCYSYEVIEAGSPDGVSAHASSP